VSKKKNDVHFKIYDMSNPEKPIYDNANDRYMPQILFENEMDRKLRFDVVVNRSKKDVIPDEIICMGFNVQQKMFRIKREKKRAI
ncbi:MAG: hypothetical protein MI922_29800, partial [Bacteroidales bacterium]|nr:hypothetical protein [Bacteroidales bacterium]